MAVMDFAEQEMIDGYRDGLDLDSPPPSSNRTASYRHGFANGRDDRASNPRAPAQWLREEAERCLTFDRRFNLN